MKVAEPEGAASLMRIRQSLEGGRTPGMRHWYRPLFWSFEAMFVHGPPDPLVDSLRVIFDAGPSRSGTAPTQSMNTTAPR